MAENEAVIKVTVAIGDEEYTIDLSHEMERPMNLCNPISFLRTYIIHTSTDTEVLKALGQGFFYRDELVYNPNIGSELADMLADELDVTIKGGYYLEKYYVLLSNPSLSGKKLSELAHKHFKRFHKGNTLWYLDSDMLAAIARNPSTRNSTLYWMQHCGIEKVEHAAKRND